MEKSIFEQMGGTYTLGADGKYYPDLSVPEEEPAHYRLASVARKVFPCAERSDAKPPGLQYS